MKNWFKYPDPIDPDSIYKRQKTSEAVSRVYKAAGISDGGYLLAECFINSAYMPVYAFLETPDEIAEFLRDLKSNCEPLNFDRGRGEGLEATIREHLMNGKCLVQIWGSSDTTDRVYELTSIMLDAANNQREYVEFPLGDGIVACRCHTNINGGRAICLYWFTKDTASGRVSDEEAFAALDGID